MEDATNSSSYAYIHMLTGKIDFAVMCGAKPWDHLAPALILAEAGGLVQMLGGKNYIDPDGKIILLPNRSGKPHIPYRGGIIAMTHKMPLPGLSF